MYWWMISKTYTRRMRCSYHENRGLYLYLNCIWICFTYRHILKMHNIFRNILLIKEARCLRFHMPVLLSVLCLFIIFGGIQTSGGSRLILNIHNFVMQTNIRWPRSICKGHRHIWFRSKLSWIMVIWPILNSFIKIGIEKKNK